MSSADVETIRDAFGMREAFAHVASSTPHLQGCDKPDDPNCAACIAASEIARFDEGNPMAALDALVSERERLQESNDALQRSAIRNRDGRKRAEADVERLTAQLAIADEQRANHLRRLTSERAQLAEAQQALRRVKANADAWHGNEGLGSGHARALSVISQWCDAALAVSPGGGTVERTQEEVSEPEGDERSRPGSQPFYGADTARLGVDQDPLASGSLTSGAAVERTQE